MEPDPFGLPIVLKALARAKVGPERNRLQLSLFHLPGFAIRHVDRQQQVEAEPEPEAD
jgi:hypothetical protein